MDVKSGVLFDLDETLIDRGGTLRRYAALFYAEFEDQIVLSKAEFMNTVDELDGHGRTPRDEFFHGLVERAALGWSLTTLERHFYENAWRSTEPFPDVLEALKEIRRRGFPVGIVTNGRREVQTAKIRNSGLTEYFDTVVISEEFGARKPDPSIFLHGATALGIEAQSSWFVGDDPVADIEGASKFGFRTAWLERHLPWPAEIAECYRIKVSQISDLLEVLPDAG